MSSICGDPGSKGEGQRERGRGMGRGVTQKQNEKKKQLFMKGRKLSVGWILNDDDGLEL